MKIYVNEQYNIISLEHAPEYFYKELESDLTRQQLLGRLCDTCISGYRYEPIYELLYNESGMPFYDPDKGDNKYKVGEHGEKIQIGWQCYPFVDHQILMMIQCQYEEDQKYIIALQLALTEQYEMNLALEEEVTSTQKALTEIYERIEV